MSLSTNALFSFNEIISKIAFLNFFDFSPSNIIVLIIGFSSTVIVSMLFEKLAEILEKNFVS